MADLGLWRCASQLSVLWSATLASVAMLTVVRAHALEPLFGGLDQAVRLHRKLGLTAILMLVIHVLFLTADAVAQGISATSVLVPFSSPTARSIDIMVFYGLIALGLLAYDKRLRYELFSAPCSEPESALPSPSGRPSRNVPQSQSSGSVPSP